MPLLPGKDRQLLLNLTTFYGEEEVLEKAARKGAA